MKNKNTQNLRYAFFLLLIMMLVIFSVFQTNKIIKLEKDIDNLKLNLFYYDNPTVHCYKDFTIHMPEPKDIYRCYQPNPITKSWGNCSLLTNYSHKDGE